MIPLSTLVLIADSRILKRVQRMATCQAVSTPPQFRSGNQACSASRAGIASQVGKVIEQSLLFFPLLYRLADATLQYSQFKCRVCCQCAADGFGYYVSMGYLCCLWGFSAMEGQAEILMNYLSHQVLVNDLSQIQFPVYKEGC